MPERVRAEDVHKRDAANVWVDGAVVDSLHTLSVSFLVPPIPPALRLVELMEVQRQAGMLQLHQQVDVVHEDVLVLDRIGLRLLTHSGVSDAYRRGRIRTHLVSLSETDRGPRSLTQFFTIEAASGLIAIGRSHVKVLPRRLYERLRKRRAGSESTHARAAESVARMEPILRNPTDPLTSDHASDHVTAMQMAAAVESAAARLQTGSALRSMKRRFDSYVESAPQAFLRFAAVTDGKVRGSVEQGGSAKAKFSASIIRVAGQPNGVVSA